MTVVVAFLCTDGVVVATDSMLTSFMGKNSIAYHKGKKISVLNGQQLFAFTGNQGQGARFRDMASYSYAQIDSMEHAIDYPLTITKKLIRQFQDTGIADKINLNTVLAYIHDGAHYCCVFGDHIQSWLLDKDHFYVALGTGKLSADPFLRYLVDIFCKEGQPNVREAVFLTTWAMEHVIQTNPGGVAEPIRIATLEGAESGEFIARELSQTDIDELRESIEVLRDTLRASINKIQSGETDDNVPHISGVDKN